MRDPSLALQKAYFEALDSNVVVGSATIPVYDRVPPQAGKDYIVLGEDTVVEESPKDRFASVVTFTVHCFTRQPIGAGGKKRVKQIADEVLQIVKAGLSATGFNIVYSILEFAQTLPEPGETDFTYHRVLRFRHFIDEVEVSS